MTQPQPTQSRHPWRATARTAVAVIGGILSLLPYLSDIATTAQIDTVPAVAQMLAVSAVITRVLAIPAVNDLLRRYRLTRALAAEPAPRPPAA